MVHWLVYKLKRWLGFNRRQRQKEARRESQLRSLEEQADLDLWNADRELAEELGVKPRYVAGPLPDPMLQQVFGAALIDQLRQLQPKQTPLQSAMQHQQFEILQRQAVIEQQHQAMAAGFTRGLLGSLGSPLGRIM